MRRGKRLFERLCLYNGGSSRHMSDSKSIFFNDIFAPCFSRIWTRSKAVFHSCLLACLGALLAGAARLPRKKSYPPPPFSNDASVSHCMNSLLPACLCCEDSFQLVLLLGINERRTHSSYSSLQWKEYTCTNLLQVRCLLFTHLQLVSKLTQLKFKQCSVTVFSLTWILNK